MDEYRVKQPGEVMKTRQAAESSAAQQNGADQEGSPSGHNVNDAGASQTVREAGRGRPRDARHMRRGGRARRTRRRALLASLGVTALAGLSLMLYGAYQVTQLQDEAAAATQLTPAIEQDVRAFDFTAASAKTSELQRLASSANDRAHGVLFDVATVLPYVGDDILALQSATEVANGIAYEVLPRLLEAGEGAQLDSLAPQDGRVNLEPLAQAATPLREAQVALSGYSQRLEKHSEGNLLGPVASKLDSLRESLSATEATTLMAADTAAVLPGLLGAQEPRDILILFQNNAEARTRGGNPGAAAILHTEDGSIELQQQLGSGDFSTPKQPVVVGPDSIGLHSDRVGRYIQNVNLTPDFPTAAQIAVDLYGLSNDGREPSAVVAVDPVALSYLLGVTGPVTVPGAAQMGFPQGAQLTQENATSTLLFDVYAATRDGKTADQYFAAAAGAAFAKIISVSSGSAAVEALQKATEEGRFYAWSSNPEEQEIISRHPIGGAFTAQSIGENEVGVFLNAATASKLSYFLKQEISTRPWCTAGSPDGAVSGTFVTLTLTSTVPEDLSGLPRYVIGYDREGAAPGVQDMLALLYAGPESQITGVRLDGEPVATTKGAEFGLPAQVATVMLDPGETRTLEAFITKVDPAGVNITHTPLALPAVVKASKTCSK